jgi:hypothetical protein
VSASSLLTLSLLAAMTSFLTLLGYIIVAFSFAGSPTAARETELPEREDSVVHHGEVSLATANSGSTSSNSNSYFKNVKNENELAIIQTLLSHHLGDDSNYSNQDSMNMKPEKWTTTHGQGANIIHNGRNLQTSNTSGKGKKKNKDEFTCALDVSPIVFSIRQLAVLMVFTCI